MSDPRRPGRFDFGVRDEPEPWLARLRRPLARVVKPVLVVVALAGGGAWLWTHPDQIPTSVRSLLRDTPLAPPAGQTRLYRWRDVEGNVQITDRVPPPGVEYETLDYQHDTNVLPSLRTDND